MAYRWSLDGPAFEFPSPYRSENRFLALRGYLLIALAVVVALVVAFVGESDAARPAVLLDKLPEKASAVPHLTGALLMVVLGALNLMQASRQRKLLLSPGQPMSLIREVSHEAAGSSPGAAWLMQAMDRGVAAVPQLTGPYGRWLRRLGGDLAAAPTTLHDYLRVRFARLLLHVGLVLMWALAALAALALAKPAALHLVALVVCLLGAGALARHLLYPAQAAPGPLAIAAAVSLGLVIALPLAWFSAVLPWSQHWPRLGLPVAAAVMLALGLTFELLGLLAARAQLVAPRGARVVGDSVTVSFDADPGRLLGELDRELQRRWAEGVPNRRYARLPPLIDPALEEGSFAATVLEESQPMGPAVARGAAMPAATAAPTKARWLLLLELLGLCASAIGGLLWVWLARAHMLDSTASWLPASLGLVCLLSGGYALRIGHVLWSRVEVDSTLIWLDIKGAYFRVPDAAGASGLAGRASNALPVAVDGLTLKACVARVRSVFYAAAAPGAGSRALLSLADDPAAARSWLAVAQAFARSVAAGAPAELPAVVAARAKVRARLNAEPEAAVASRRPSRFCSACGSPLLVGGRFCPHCATPVAAA